jgi:transposase-like protein
MPRSTVQFQRGLSLTSFLATYGTEEQCREALYRIRWPSGFCCPRCGHRSWFLIKTRMLYQCTGCRTQTSLMSGTVFGCSKLPLTIWFLAIFLITQSKNGISSLALSRSTGISPTAALRMKHKLQQAMKNHDDSLALSRVVHRSTMPTGAVPAMMAW